MSSADFENMMDGSVTLEREDWLQIIQDLLAVGPILKSGLEKTVKVHPEAVAMLPAVDPNTFEADVRAACAACAYVAEFAADKCRFIPVKEE